MMKYPACLLLMLFLFTGCDIEKRENELKQKQALLDQKGQMLQLKETELMLREQQLTERENKLDSSIITDSLNRFKPIITGEWTTKMTCIETTCPGSAIGDSKTEKWIMSYSGNNIIAEANAGANLTREYVGHFINGMIELVEERPGSGNQPSSKIIIRLTIKDDKTMEGQREIIRGSECKVLYTLTLSKD